MMSVAERLIVRKAAPAKRDHRATRQPELLALRIVNREIAFNPNRSVVNDRYLCRCHDVMLTQNRREADLPAAYGCARLATSEDKLNGISITTSTSTAMPSLVAGLNCHDARSWIIA